MIVDPEQEPQAPETTLIQVGQFFNLLELGRIKKREYSLLGHNINIFSSEIILETSEVSSILPNIPFEIAFSPSRHQRSESITPFMTEEGYIINDRDFDPNQKKEKLKEIGYEQISLKNPLFININQSDETALINLGLAHKNKFKNLVLEDRASPDLKRLRLQLFFPGEPGVRWASAFEAPLNDSWFRLGKLSFIKFLPLDLSLSPDLQGFSLYVPSDVDLLKQIRAKFIFKEQEKEDEELSEFSVEDQS